jgi:RNA polymerase sigma-70 factor (ECF subfamily)
VTLAEYEQTILRDRDRVFGYAVRMMGDRDEAADVVQDAMLKMWSHREHVEADGATGWLIRVTRNACLDALRRRSFENGLFVRDPDGPDPEGSEPSPDGALAAGQFREHLERLLARLREPYRSILILREIEDCRYDEISAALDLPLTSVKVYLHRARHMLKAMISPGTLREHV